ncbi:MAG: YlmH/Sll1252 family protein [Tissierellaceae bacterium]|nr:YlmH/Sll1252 family protein [Tissierellaceae bacterium]
MKLDRDFYTSHIKSKEKVFLMRRLIDKIEIVLSKHIVQSTDFLDPYERLLAKSILNRFNEIGYSEDGQNKNSERQIIVIFPQYYVEFCIHDFITAIRIKGDLQSLNHRDCLGSILGLGIKRDKVGDILVYSDHMDVVLKREVAGYILMNLEKIGNRKVVVSKIPLNSLSEGEVAFREIQKTLSSNRLDVYLSAVYNLSRSESRQFISSDKVKVNWEEIDKASKEIKAGDVISVRGIGRSILYSIDGFSKKGKIKANIRIII